jgi:hypothetical protein
MTKVTLDTNVVDNTDLVAVAPRAGCELVVVSVTEREMEGSPYVIHLVPFGQVPEVAVYGEGSLWSGSLRIQPVGADARSDFADYQQRLVSEVRSDVVGWRAAATTGRPHS